MQSRARRNVVLALVYSSVMASLIALSPYYDELNPDTIIAYLVSLVRWTPFYWAQDRYGMVIPALTQWLTEPLLNVIVQHAVHATCSLLTFFLLARLIYPRARWPLIGVVAGLMYVALNGQSDIKDFFTPWQIYTPAMMFGLAGVLVARRNLPVAIALTAVAEWCNFSIFLLTGLLTLADGAEVWTRRGGRAALAHAPRPVLLVTVGAIFGGWLRRAVGDGEAGGYAAVGGLAALNGWVHLVHTFVTIPRANVAFLWLPLAAGVIVFGYLATFDWARLERRRWALRRFLVAQFALFGYIFVVGASAFAPGNGYPHRYLIPALMTWIVAWTGVLCELGARRGWRAWALAPLMVPLILYRFGAPSVAGVRQAIDGALGPRYGEVPAECTHVVGDYYRAWPVAFYSRLIHARPLWAITYRSKVTADLWAFERFARPVVCSWADDQETVDQFLTLPVLKGFVRRDQRGPMIVWTRP